MELLHYLSLGLSMRVVHDEPWSLQFLCRGWMEMRLWTLMELSTALTAYCDHAHLLLC